tara:strand:- start:7988 stop:8992 length:1005 start_codon:yes stop_codon:yes gene_type:complete
VNFKNIVIVGLGSIGLRHLRIAREIFPESRIAVLRHKETNEIPDGADEVFFNLNHVIQFQPQIAIICSPASTHIEISRALVKQGIHILIEKPISNEKKGLEELNREAVENNCVVTVGYNLRFLPSLKKFKDLIDKNFVGDLYSVRGEVGQYLPNWRKKDYRKTVSAQKILGGGVLLELSHELDYLRWIFGEVESVQAQLSRQSQLDIDVEDTAHIILKFKENKNNINLMASLNLDFIRHDTVRMCHAIGDKGSLRWNGLTGDVDLFKSEKSEWKNIYKYEADQDESYKNEWFHFIECINKENTPNISFQDGIKVLDIIDSIKISSSSGKKVMVK